MWDSNCDVCQFSSTQRSKCNDMEPFLDQESSSNLIKNEDLSFYGSNSPIKQACTSPAHCNHNKSRRLDDYDHNSQDSGYGISYNAELQKFSSYVSPSRSSRMSFGSLEDEFLEDISDIEPLDNENTLPKDFKKLISGSMAPKIETIVEEKSPKDTIIRPYFRRALSLQNERDTPNSSRVRSCLFSIDRPFKRPERPTEESPSKSKRSKVGENEKPTRPVLQRAFSASEETIKFALQRSSTEDDLIGDFSTSYSLPLTQGRHQDLKSITPQTLSQLMSGGFEDVIASFKVIDCRYPYEFDGGHIDGAINIYTKEQCVELLNECKIANKPTGKHILVFHCEFSSERGPNLFRYLRQQDRCRNQEFYPALQYPEVYLLEGGYKNFFGQFASMCVPVAYKQMLHPEHEEDLRYFRQKSKTWNADSRQRTHQRSNLKRLL